MNSESVTVICSFRVRRDAEAEFQTLLANHWPVLREQGLATDAPAQHFRGDDNGRGPIYVEIFEWVDAAAPQTAHNSPAVMAIWEPMGALVEARGDDPAMAFPHFATLDL